MLAPTLITLGLLAPGTSVPTPPTFTAPGPRPDPPAAATPGSEVAAPERVLVRSVRLLRPGSEAADESTPVDVLIVDGVIDRIGEDLDVRMRPGEFIVRRPDLRLLPAPTIRILEPGSSSSGLVHAAVLGIGCVELPPGAGDPAALESRVRLDERAVPGIVVGSPEAPTSVRSAEGPCLDHLLGATLPTDPAEVRRLLGCLGQADVDPFSRGAEARFLLLEADPWDRPEALSDPHAILQGSTLVLKTERLVLMEELAAFLELDPPESDLLDWPADPASEHLYHVVIAGLPRGYVRVAHWNEPDGGVTVRVAERIAAPIHQSLDACVRWPSGAVECTRRIQDRIFRMWTDARGGSLHVTLDGRSLSEGPIDLAPRDQFLPHELFGVHEALVDPSGGAITHVVDLEVAAGPFRVSRSPRPRPRIPPADHPLLKLLTADCDDPPGVGRGGALQLVYSEPPADPPAAGEDDATLTLLLDGGHWPSRMLQVTPWGAVEWISGQPKAGKSVFFQSSGP